MTSHDYPFWLCCWGKEVKIYNKRVMFTSGSLRVHLQLPLCLLLVHLHYFPVHEIEAFGEMTSWSPFEKCVVKGKEVSRNMNFRVTFWCLGQIPCQVLFIWRDVSRSQSCICVQKVYLIRLSEIGLDNVRIWTHSWLLSSIASMMKE